ncbi:MAG TPA: efflux RND transporter permease subunit, partial [Kofleriaceae bacterium]
MWIVRLALRRPYTFAVMALMMLVLGITSIIVMRKDIFPFINIPVVSVIWSYTGMPPQEMADRIVTIDERAMTTAVNDIEHLESTSYPGIAVIKVYFHPGTKVDGAIAQITALSQSILRPLPPGIFSPLIIQYDASSVPLLQLALSSEQMSQQEIYDYGSNFIRTQLATVEGASVPLPYGGESPQIMVDLDPNAMYARGLSAIDVSNALGNQNLIVPAGTAKIGSREYVVQLNSSPLTIEGLNALPIRLSNGALIYMRDVAQIRQGHIVQTNIVRKDGLRGALLTELKHGESSTLDIVDGVKKKLATSLSDAPKGLHVDQLFDQSIFVKAAMNGVLREGAIAAALTGLMILLFLGSWRSTLIVFLTIPLSILTSLSVLALLGQTINIMTLGGLALAVGVLVDDATVEMENMYRNLEMKKPLARAILDGAQQIAIPALVSTLSICIVFVPVLLLTGVAKYLFTPLAGAVVIAMLTSYLLSRTVIPPLAHLLLPKELEGKDKDEKDGGNKKKSLLERTHEGFEKRFERVRDRYKGALEWALDHRPWVLIPFVVIVLASLPLIFLIGR